MIINAIWKNVYQCAIDDHNKAIQLNPDNVNACKNQGIAYLSKVSKNLG